MTLHTAPSVSCQFLLSIEGTNWFQGTISSVDLDYEIVCPYSSLGCRHICLRTELDKHLAKDCRFNKEPEDSDFETLVGAGCLDDEASIQQSITPRLGAREEYNITVPRYGRHCGARNIWCLFFFHREAFLVHSLFFDHGLNFTEMRSFANIMIIIIIITITEESCSACSSQSMRFDNSGQR